MMANMTKLLAATAAACLVAGAPAHADEHFPDHPVEIIVAYPAGGGIDTLARLVGLELGKRLGQSVVVVNKPGAAGAIGTAAAARARPDGYTLLLSGANAILSPLVDPKLTFDIGDFAPVARLTETPYVLAVNPKLGVDSIAGLIDYSKSHGGELNYASTGIGSVQHLFGALLQSRTGVEWMHVPYHGGNDSLRELAAGRVHLMFSNPIPLTPYLKEGAINVIGVATDTRIPILPDVRTFEEQGQEDFNFKTWVGLLAPAGTPESIRTKIDAEIEEILLMPAIRTAIEQQGSIVAPLPASDFGKFLQSDKARWESILQQSGFTPAS